MRKPVLCLLPMLFMCQVSTSIPPPLSATLDRGFGSHIKWKTLMAACSDSIKSRKPVMLVIHQKWCQACRDLMPEFRKSPYIAKLAPLFEMVNVMDAEEPMDPKFKPDGGYYPRILFMSPEGEVRTDIVNPEAMEKYLYYYFDAESVARSMLKAVHTFYQVQSDGNENEL